MIASIMLMLAQTIPHKTTLSVLAEYHDSNRDDNDHTRNYGQ